MQNTWLATTSNDKPGWNEDKIALPFVQGCTAECISFLSSGRSKSLDGSSSSSSGYCAGSMKSDGRNFSVWYRKIAESTQVLTRHSLDNCPETLLQSSVSPNINKKHVSRHIWTLYAPEAPCEVNISTRVFRFSCSSWVHSRSMRCAFFFGIRTSGFLLASVESDHSLIVQGFAIYIIRCAASYWASSAAALIASIKLFTV